MSEISAHTECLKTLRERLDDVNDVVALDTAVQAMALLDRIKASPPLRDAVERALGEDIWPT